ncbi:MAG: ABC transporter ATP-binding protein [Actinomycetia bacterium]|nr:ABC transporter ATP-binding protein [Actinomycetes bacterium]
MKQLELTRVAKRFGRFTANDDISFDVCDGEVVGLLGANGAGKTTAIRQALGLIAPTEGVITQFGEIPSRHTRARIGYVPQGLGLWGDLSVAANLDFTARSYGAGHDSVEAASATLPSDLDRHSRTAVDDLSLGRQRRVAFTAALEHDPELLVLDEPTSGVDALSRSRLWDLIRTRADAGVGVLVTTHFMDEARQCDRLLIMAEGHIVLRGTYDEIVGDRTVIKVDSTDWAATFGLLDEAGFSCSVVGTAIRVLTGDRAAVESALADSDADPTLSDATATLEETMVAVARG